MARIVSCHKYMYLPYLGEVSKERHSMTWHSGQSVSQSSHTNADHVTLEVKQALFTYLI